MSPARAAAWRALLRMRRAPGHMELSVAAFPELDGLDDRDRALANELVIGTVKRRGSLDAILGRFTKAPLKTAHPDVREALRLAAFQLLYLDRVPAYAAVDDAVAMATAASPRAAGFVNAVLRKVAAEGRQALAALGEGDKDAAWAVRHSAPRWLVGLLRREFGDESARAVLDAANEPAERCLRVNTLKTTVDEARAELAAAGFATRGVPGLPAALVYDGPGIERSQPFLRGLVTPQSRGSQTAGVVAAAGAGPGARILDLCAAPGTKTAQLAAAAPAAALTAVDVDEARLAALRANLERLAVHAELLAADALALPDGFEEAFDIVLLDAPCSGLGTLASRPDLRWRRRVDDVSRLAALQRKLLAAAARCVKPGGALTYAVCTLPGAETIDVVEAFLAGAGDDWSVDDLGAAWPGLAHPRAGGFLLALPPEDGSTGFFVARLRRSPRAAG